jgi:hypothetical protein
VALEQFQLGGQVAIVTGAARSTRDCYATNSTFVVDGGLQGPNSSLPIPDL